MELNFLIKLHKLIWLVGTLTFNRQNMYLILIVYPHCVDDNRRRFGVFIFYFLDLIYYHVPVNVSVIGRRRSTSFEYRDKLSRLKMSRVFYPTRRRIDDKSYGIVNLLSIT